jgi:chemotaxis protein CheD
MAGSPTVSAVFAQRVVIGVGDMAVSNSTQVVLSTYALGSCIGLIAYDPAQKAGGILHYMLPDSTISPEKAQRQPAMFADTGLPLFFRSLGGLKAERGRLRLLIAGGASVIAGQDPFKIGERNTLKAAEFLRANGLSVVHADTGGAINRTVHLEINTGLVTLKRPTDTVRFDLGAGR